MQVRFETFALQAAAKLLPLAFLLSCGWGQKSLLDEAKSALSKAIRFFRTEVAVNGSYVWTYSEDLKRRWGESEATETEGWVQPPGTPSVGIAFLRAYEATGDKTYLDTAVETAHALTATQLASGGWDYRIEFHHERRKRWFYRRDIESGEKDPKGRRNWSVYDDDNTQSALRFLMQVDVALKGRDKEIRRAVEYGLAKLIEAQYPNGAWPQRYDGNPPNPENHPVIPARYPAQWSRTHPGKGYQYWRLYTLNDRVMGTIIQTLLDAYRLYGKREYLKAACKGGDFLILAQMPDPQPAWAQQYNFQMEPAWARRFEPPAIASAESANAVQILLELYLVTGDERYLRPVPKALDWFKRSQLPNGRWARFYELKTNRPLYVNRNYELVYTPENLREGYAFEGSFGITRLFKLYEQLKREGREKLLAERNRKPTLQELAQQAKELEPKVRQIIASMDARGRWVEDGRIHTKTFIRNVETLANYIAAASKAFQR
jgi:hypothetical protein